MNRKTGGVATPYRWRVVGADGETLCAPSRGLARGPAAVYHRLSDARRIARTLRRHGHAAAVVPYDKGRHVGRRVREHPRRGMEVIRTDRHQVSPNEVLDICRRR